jgi:drug/metabolite transporter (DMT)-like permease
MQFWIAAMATPILLAATALGHVSGIDAMQVGIPSLLVVMKCALVALTATLSHTFIYLATTRASAAIVAPMTYAQLLLAVAIGWVVFGDVPDLMSALGAALIVGSGLALWRWR